VKPETKPAVKPEVKPTPVVKPEPVVKHTTPAAKPEAKPAVKPVEHSTVKPETKPAVKPEVQPKGTITVTMKNTEGQLIGQVESATGVVGSADTLSMPTIPTGYKEKSMTVNGVAVNKMPATFKDNTQEVVIVVASTTAPVRVVFESNGRVITTQTKTMTVGSKLTDSLIPSALSEHYTISSVTVDGQPTGKNVSGTVQEGENVVVVSIARK
ncbi:MAG: MucBP domain-containing protein, partial [Clostridium sp.]